MEVEIRGDKSQSGYARNDSRSGWHILCIDDDPAILEAYEVILNAGVNEVESSIEEMERMVGLSQIDGGILERKRFRVDTACSGEEGLQRVEYSIRNNDPYAVICIDIRMPGGWDGIKTAEKIMELTNDVKIILITAYADFSEVDIRGRLGMNYYFVRKPFEHDGLRQMIEMLSVDQENKKIIKKEMDLLDKRNGEYRNAVEESDKKRARLMKELLKEYEFNELILRSMAEGLLVVDHYGNIKQVNRAVEEMTGMDELDLLGRPVNIMLSKSGTGDEENLEGVITDGVLTTATRQLQKLILDSPRGEERFYRWVDEALIGALLIDEECNIVLSSVGMGLLTGWRSKDLQGGALSRLVPASEKVARLDEYILSLLGSDERHEGSRGGYFNVLSSEGGKYCLEFGAIPLVVEEKKLILGVMLCPNRIHQWELFLMTSFGRVFTGTSLSEKTYADWIIEHASGEKLPVRVTGSPVYKAINDNQLLEGVVVVLSDLADSIAAETEKAANKAKDDFLAVMSHELRTPITTIISNTELLLDNQVRDAKDDQMLLSVQAAGISLLSVVNDILDHAKIKNGNFSIDEKPFDLEQLTRRIESIFMQRSRIGDTRFVVERDFYIENKVVGDEQRISQILINLLGNAFKFTGNGRVLLRVKIDKGWIKFYVIDTGIGMSKEELTRVFSPFEQANSSTSRTYGGTGLGLSISQSLARLMGGAIDVESTHGKGTQFSLRVPFKESSELLRTEIKKQASYGSRQFNARVLVAEDAPELQLLMKRILGLMGVTVTIARNGEEASRLALAMGFDLIFMDMQMPIKNGVEATRAIRAGNIDTPVVALTANAAQRHKDMFLEAGASDFISKPFKSEDIVCVLDKYFSENNRVNTADHPQGKKKDPAEWSDYELSRLFTERLIVVKSGLLQQINTENWGALLGAAHSLKDLGGTFGCWRVTELSAEVVRLIEERSYSHAKEHAGELLEEIGCRIQEMGPQQVGCKSR